MVPPSIIPTFDSTTKNCVVMSRSHLHTSRGSLWRIGGAAAAAFRHDDQAPSAPDTSDDGQPNEKAEEGSNAKPSVVVLAGLPAVVSKVTGNARKIRRERWKQAQSAPPLLRGRQEGFKGGLDRRAVLKSDPVHHPGIEFDFDVEDDRLEAAQFWAKSDGKPCAKDLLEGSLVELAEELNGHVDQGLALFGWQKKEAILAEVGKNPDASLEDVDEDALWSLVASVKELPMVEGSPFTAEELMFAPFPPFREWAAGGAMATHTAAHRDADKCCADAADDDTTAAPPVVGAGAGASMAVGVRVATAAARLRQRAAVAAAATAELHGVGRLKPTLDDGYRQVEDWRRHQREGYLRAIYDRARVLYRRSGQVLTAEEACLVRDARGALAFLLGTIYKGYPTARSNVNDGKKDSTGAAGDAECFFDEDDDEDGVGRSFGLTPSGRVSGRNLWLDCCGLNDSDRRFLNKHTVSHFRA